MLAAFGEAVWSGIIVGLVEWDCTRLGGVRD